MSLAGVGLGLRPPHFQALLDGPALPDPAWLELLADNYLWLEPERLDAVLALRARYPMALHSVGLNLGGCEPLDHDYIQRLRQLAVRCEALSVSDHLCFTGAGGLRAHDLLPLPYTAASVAHCAARIGEVQDRLGRQILLENVSSYLNYQQAEMTEAAFLVAVAEAADCLLLVDVNNIHVSASNHGLDAQAYLRSLPTERVRELHLAGFEDRGTHLLDTHGRCVQPPVWALYELALQLFGDLPSLIEWDTDIPPLPVLLGELSKAETIRGGVFADAG